MAVRNMFDRCIVMGSATHVLTATLIKYFILDKKTELLRMEHDHSIKTAIEKEPDYDPRAKHLNYTGKPVASFIRWVHGIPPQEARLKPTELIELQRLLIPFFYQGMRSKLKDKRNVKHWNQLTDIFAKKYGQF